MSQSVWDKITKGTIGLVSGASTGGVTAAAITGGTIFIGGCAIAVAAPLAAGAGVAAVASAAVSGGSAAIGLYGTAGCAAAGGVAAVCGGAKGAADAYNAPSKTKALLRGIYHIN